jgi:branched-subunit amino acid aminotransferase/4-amino-4-deoxychorismate lyase
MVTVFLNGKFLGRDEAMVSAFDAGLQHGVGLFETMLAVPGDGEPAVVSLGEHLDRLIGSARLLGLSDSLRRQPLADAVVETVKRSGITADGRRARVRLTVTGGDLNLLGRSNGVTESRSDEGRHPGPSPAAGHVRTHVDPTVLVVAQPATEYPADFFERGVAVTLADLKVNPLDPMSGHKTINYWGRLRELQIAAGKKAGEALVFQVTNHLAGGCVSNAFIVKDGRLLTPIARGEEAEVAAEGDPEAHAGAVMPSPVLPGVVRRLVMEAAKERGIEVDRRMLTIHDVLGADEVFLTNSSWGVLPVVKVEREAIGDGVVGMVTKRVREAVLAAWALE